MKNFLDFNAIILQIAEIENQYRRKVMYRIYYGQKPGSTTGIMKPIENLEEAKVEARKIVKVALKTGDSCIAVVFGEISGVVVAGFATPNLADQIWMYPLVKVIQP